MFIYRVIFFTILFTLTSTSLVKWLPNGSFNLPSNFNDGKLPCSKKTVVFPDVMTSAVKLESEVEAAAFVLPVEGDIILDGLIAFGANVDDTNCTDGNAFYMDKNPLSWQRAGAWSSSKFNEATPDVYRVPCYNDIAEFPDARYTVILPDVHQYITGLNIGNQSYSNEEFATFSKASSDSQQAFVLNKFLSTGIVITEPKCNQKYGCPCQRNILEIDCSGKYCPKPSCVAPVQPLGFCCKFCGGYITFDIDQGFDRDLFEELVKKTVSSYGKSVVYNIGFTPVQDSHSIQLVVVDKDEYTGASAAVVSSIDYAMERHWFKGLKEARISGSPLYKAGLGGKIFVSMFFAVVLVMGAIYVYYYGTPKIDFSVMNRSTRGMFTRFQGRSDSILSLTRRDSTVLGATRTAFRNPMYDSKRGRVQVEESVAEN